MSWEMDSAKERPAKAAAKPPVDRAAKHRRAARRFHRAAPPYSIFFEDDGRVTLRRKRYEYWEYRSPEEATTWTIISTHDNVDEAQRRLRLICCAPLFYDDAGRPTKPPEAPACDEMDD